MPELCQDDDAEGSDDSETSSSEDSDEENEADEGGLAPLSADDEAVENEMENDFDRLVQNIRTGDASSGSGSLTKDWDFNIREQEAEFRDDLRAASGIGRKRVKRGRAAGPTLSPQVRALIGEGNQAWVDCNIPEAIRIMQEVIRIEPRAAEAWSVLAKCYEDAKEDQKALQLRIMAAHLRHDADEWDRLAKQSCELGFKQQALYCYRKVFRLDPSNVHALWDRAFLAKEIGDLRTAKHAFLAILTRYPSDLAVLSELRPILIELAELETCASLFKNAFDSYKNLHPSGRGPHPQTHIEVAGGGFGLMEILVLADLYNTLGEYENAAIVVRKGCRWLQGRAAQKYWDVCTDDREYDAPDSDGKSSLVRQGDPGPGFYPLDVNARHRLAIARLKLGDTEEGQNHANIVLSEDVYDYAPLFSEIADAYFDRNMFAEARSIYELLGSDAATSSMEVLLQTAACLRNLGELPEAAEIYEHIRSMDPTQHDVKIKLAEVYEILGETRKALDLVYEVIDSRKRKPGDKRGDDASQNDSAAHGDSLFAEGKKTGKAKPKKSQNRLTHAELLELEAQKEKDVVNGHLRLKELWPLMMAVEGADGQVDAEREWLLEAEKLVEMFRETRNLFMTTRSQPFRGMFPRLKNIRRTTEADEDRIASRLHLELERDTVSRKSGKKGQRLQERVDMFRGVTFADWLRLFMQYTFLLTKRDQYDLAAEVLRHIILSNAYQARELQDTIRLTLITCSTVSRRYDVVVEQCRKLVNSHQFNNEPLRLLLASLASGLRPTDAFITSTLQKHMLREMKLSDAALKNPESLRYHAALRRWAPVQGKAGEDDDDDEPVGDTSKQDGEGSSDGGPRLPTKPNPMLVAIYGQLCVAAKSYQSAIFYLLHAYDYCPNDPVICLCLAIASLGRAMQRQSDNRHHLVTQAMAFLTKYRQCRNNSADENEEVEYNFGRAFHQLGLYSLAVKHYEIVLAMAESRTPEETDNGLAREAALNLSMIYVTTGATPLAEALYRRWLSF
ncbi:hypothetical protein HGRIS_000791 [Hohenbuehelia grisea]|uniref:TPR-like protein n=1 Tax=Hohenbuehelia grisea TaxID=104357 RepID=A0ABR3IPQ8_9AGAR